MTNLTKTFTLLRILALSVIGAMAFQSAAISAVLDLRAETTKSSFRPQIFLITNTSAGLDITGCEVNRKVYDMKFGVSDDVKVRENADCKKLSKTPLTNEDLRKAKAANLDFVINKLKPSTLDKNPAYSGDYATSYLNLRVDSISFSDLRDFEKQMKGAAQANNDQDLIKALNERSTREFYNLVTYVAAVNSKNLTREGTNDFALADCLYHFQQLYEY